MLAVARATAAPCALIGRVLAILSGTCDSFTPSEVSRPGGGHSALVVAHRQPVRGGPRLAAQHEALGHLIGFQAEVLVHAHAALQHLGTTGAAHAVATRIRRVQRSEER